MYYARKYPKEVTVKTVSNIQKNTAIPLAYRSSRLSTYFFVISLYFLININNVCAVQVTLGWDQNNEPDIAGYKIYYGASSGNYTQSKDVQDKDATSCTITNLIEGQTYYFAATTYNTSLLESDYSAEISYNSNPAGVFARCIPQRVLRPWLRDTRCFWLLVYCPIGSHVNSQSTIMITGPETQATGVKVNEQRQLVIMARMLWVPVCIEQGATIGQWNLLIKTDVGDSALEESIIASLEVR